MTTQEWMMAHARCLGVFLAGEGLDERDPRGRLVRDDNFLLLLNAHHEPIEFTMPPKEFGSAWVTVIDTAVERFGKVTGLVNSAYAHPGFYDLLETPEKRLNLAFDVIVLGAPTGTELRVRNLAAAGPGVRLADASPVTARAEGDDLVLAFATPLDGRFGPAVALKAGRTDE